jgi:hypothetical protein
MSNFFILKLLAKKIVKETTTHFLRKRRRIVLPLAEKSVVSKY